MISAEPFENVTMIRSPLRITKMPDDRIWEMGNYDAADPSTNVSASFERCRRNEDKKTMMFAAIVDGYDALNAMKHTMPEDLAEIIHEAYCFQHCNEAVDRRIEREEMGE